jgi:hypothetical protein
VRQSRNLSARLKAFACASTGMRAPATIRLNKKILGEKMSREIPSAFAVETIRKWLALAERRKAHLVDLYDSGRWRLYYTEADFVSCMRGAVRDVDRWSAIEQVSGFAAISDLDQGRELTSGRVRLQ